MRLRRLPHRWDVSPKRAVAIQRELAGQVIRQGSVRRLSIVAGADTAFSPGKDMCVAAVVVWDVASRTIVEQHVVRKALRFPYVPGLLSFREAPAILAAIRKLRCTPDAFLFDGQGYAHPRRFGLACHVGVLIDKPSVGCAKSLLVGTHAPIDSTRGARTPLIHQHEQVGIALRTRDNVKPLFVSVGHRVSLDGATEIVLACGTGYRLPEPTRLADKLVSIERNM